MCFKRGDELGIAGVMNLDEKFSSVAERLAKTPDVFIEFKKDSHTRPNHSVLVIQNELDNLYVYDDGVVYCGTTDDGVS